MLPPAARLRHRSEFSTAVHTGIRAGSRTLVVHLADDPNPPPGGVVAASSPRVGFVVGKAVGGAVVRNRVRRQLRHVVRDRLSWMAELAPGSRIVVRALPPAVQASSAVLAADFDAACARAVSSRPAPAGVTP